MDIFIYVMIFRQEAGFYCVKAFINGEFAASLCWQIYYYLRYVVEYRGELWRWVELILVYAVIFAILALIELNLKKILKSFILQEENCWWSLSLLHRYLP